MPSTTYDDLDVTVEAHVAWIRLDRPAAQHSLTTAMAGELHDAIAWAASDGDIRAIVLGGTEGRFCTGPICVASPGMRAMSDDSGVSRDGYMLPSESSLRHRSQL